MAYDEQLREDIRKGVYVENLTEFEVENVNDILKLLIQVNHISDPHILLSSSY